MAAIAAGASAWWFFLGPGADADEYSAWFAGTSHEVWTYPMDASDDSYSWGIDDRLFTLSSPGGLGGFTRTLTMLDISAEDSPPSILWQTEVETVNCAFVTSDIFACDKTFYDVDTGKESSAWWTDVNFITWTQQDLILSFTGQHYTRWDTMGNKVWSKELPFDVNLGECAEVKSDTPTIWCKSHATDQITEQPYSIELLTGTVSEAGLSTVTETVSSTLFHVKNGWVEVFELTPEFASYARQDSGDDFSTDYVNAYRVYSEDFSFQSDFIAAKRNLEGLTEVPFPYYELTIAQIQAFYAGDWPEGFAKLEIGESENCDSGTLEGVSFPVQGTRNHRSDQCAFYWGGAGSAYRLSDTTAWMATTLHDLPTGKHIDLLTAKEREKLAWTVMITPDIHVWRDDSGVLHGKRP